MANKRVSELAPITSVQLDSADLLLLSDISARESKKLQLTDLGNFLLSGGRLSGSLLGTASYALNAGTASNALSAPVPTLVPSASFLVYSGASNGTASYAAAALTASNAQSASLAQTASYALTASVNLVYSASFADNAKSASYLIFNSGVSNGTASFALTASSLVGGITQTSCSHADTASVAISASYATITIETISTASYLQYVGIPNGTASYALVAGGFGETIIDYGIFLAITQSVSSSQLDVVSILPTFGGLKDTEVEAYGTIRLPFTGSSPTNGNIELWVVERNYGFSHSLDSSPITSIFGGCTGSLSGSMKIPFTLAGQVPLNGPVKIYVTASNGVFIDGGRTCRFNISSESDQLSVSSGDSILFTTTPNTAIMLWSSSLHPSDHYQGSASQVTFSGSYDITELRIPASTVTTMSYTWTLIGLQKLTVDNNTELTSIGGLPTGIISMSAVNCSLNGLPLLTGSISYLNVPFNNIDEIRPLPATMSYIDVSHNSLVTLPTDLPYGLSALLADGLDMIFTPATMSNTLVSMSFNSCPNLDTYKNGVPALFPTSLAYFSARDTLLANIPTVIPSPLLFVYVSSGSLLPAYIGPLAQGLVTNGLSNGILDFTNNPNSESAINIFPNMATLRSRGWTVNGF